jgi:uncharacterized protein YajQ (UPF0234 family)
LIFSRIDNPFSGKVQIRTRKQQELGHDRDNAPGSHARDTYLTNPSRDGDTYTLVWTVGFRRDGEMPCGTGLFPLAAEFAVMAQQNTFDIVSQINHAEVVNAVDQALKEVHVRFDFKGSKSDIELEKQDAIVLSSDDEYKLKSLNDILQAKLVKRKVPLKGLTYGKIESALGGTVRQRITLQQGIPQEKAKEIVKFIKDTKLKVQVSIQGDLVRVAGKDRDTLQEVIAALRGHDFGIDMEFSNYRSN